MWQTLQLPTAASCAPRAMDPASKNVLAGVSIGSRADWPAQPPNDNAATSKKNAVDPPLPLMASRHIAFSANRERECHTTDVCLSVIALTSASPPVMPTMGIWVTTECRRGSAKSKVEPERATKRLRYACCRAKASGRWCERGNRELIMVHQSFIKKRLSLRLRIIGTPVGND